MQPHSDAISTKTKQLTSSIDTIADWGPNLDHDQSANWGIAQTAAYFDITPRTLRFYEDKGLVTPIRKTTGSKSAPRQFSPVARLRLREILRAKRAGFSLEDIREVFDVIDGRISDPAELARRNETFKRVLKSLARRRDDIDFVSKRMTELCQALDKFQSQTTHPNDRLQGQDQDRHVFQLAEEYHAKLQQSLPSPL